MKIQDIVDEIKLELTGAVLELEIEDSTIITIINKTMRELERYWDESKLITIPFSSCIDYSGTPLEQSSSIVKVYRANVKGEEASNTFDPAYAQQWMIFSNGGTMYNLNDYILNYASWTTLGQIRNTLSTDLAFREDKHDSKLYINQNLSSSDLITIEYIPKLMSVEDIKSDYWLDILIKMSTAYTKTIIGRIRTRFTESGALWGQDGDKLLEEGNAALNELREQLRVNSNLIYPID